MNLNNPSLKYKNKKIIAFLIVAMLLVATFNFIPAEASSLKEEVIYVCLNNDGSVDKVYVVNSFLIGYDKEIIDYGNYEYVQNLSNEENIKIEDGIVKVNTNEDQLYYEGILKDPQLPWDISIKYYIDGEEVPADKLAGSTGALEIEIRTKHNPLGSREFYDKYALQLAITLDTEIARNIKADGGTLSSVGECKQASYIVLPAKEGNLKLTADVKKFEMSAITIAGVQLDMDIDFEDVDMSEINELIDGIVELDDGVDELLDGVFEMKDGADELHEGTKDLSKGAGEVKDGIKELSEGVEEYRDGTSEYKDGVEELKDGAAELVDGIKDLVKGVFDLDKGVEDFKKGIKELYTGIKKLWEGAKELYDGIADIASGTKKLKTGTQELMVGASEAAEGGAGLVYGYSEYFNAILAIVNIQISTQIGQELTEDNYENILEEILFAKAKEEIYKQVEQAFLTGLGLEKPEDLDYLPTEDKQAIIQQIEEQSAATFEAQKEQILSEIIETPEAKQLYGVLEMLKAYDQLLDGLGEYVRGVDRIATGTQEVYYGISELDNGISQYKDGMDEYLSGITELYENLDEIVEGTDELKEGTADLLEGVDELQDGIIEFEDGTIKLHDGIIELYDGIVEIHDGIVELDDGFVEFNDGIVELSDGVKELLEGTDELGDGVSELKDGTEELRNETATLDKDIIDGIEEEVDEMFGKGGVLKSFVSEENGEIEAVQFVMQTEGISILDSKNNKVEADADSTIWQRFIKLFKGLFSRK